MKGGKTHKYRDRDEASIASVRMLIDDSSPRSDLLIEYLHRIQDKCNGIDARQLTELAELTGLSLAEVYETASFYTHFHLLRDRERAPEITLRVCDSISCAMSGAKALYEKLEGLDGVRVITAPCMGRCDRAPVAMLNHRAITRADEVAIVQAVEERRFVDDTLVGHIDYGQYLEQGGYRLVRECQKGNISRETLLREIQDSGLRGLGGAGFPAAKKWAILRKQESNPVLVVNIDEGEPGTFKDRFYLARDPHRMIEGALIAAFYINAKNIYLYLRDEYHDLYIMLARELGVLRKESGLELPEIHLRRGAGSYVCGEESALIESLEGKRGMPRLRPPYIAEIGLFGKPTLAHNMETLYWLRDILEKGAESFHQSERRGRSGMRSYSISGRVREPGVYRAPAGISLLELVDEYAGGMRDGHELYGYFPGGASGGMLPASLADLPLDFDVLNEYGCFIGSAAVIVFSHADSARDLALNAMRFFADESCGQCTPCRVGTLKAVELMQQPSWDQPLLRELAATMMDASICGLGQAAPNAMLCAMKYFPQEFD